MEQGLHGLKNRYKSNRQLLQVKFYLEKIFVKILYAVDECIHICLKEYMKATTIQDTKLELTAHSKIVHNIQTSQFSRILPPTVVKIVDKYADSDPQKKQQKSKATPTYNRQQEQKWCLRANENFHPIF